MQKKTVIVSGLQVFPPESGGQLRSANLAKSLSALGHQVEIISLTGRKEDYLKGLKSSSSLISENVEEYVHRGRLFAVLQLLSYRLKLAPFWITYLSSWFMPRSINEKIEKAHHLILDFPFLYPLAKKEFTLNTHNAEYELYPEKSWQRNWVRKIEIAAFQKAKQVIFCSIADRSKFSDLVQGLNYKSTIVPNGVDLTDFVFNPIIRDKVRGELSLTSEHKVFLFTGSQYGPNVEAFEFLKGFAEEYHQELAENKLVILIAGTVCREVSYNEVFKVLGRVERMSDYFWASDFGLNPVSVGSGTNVKMIEFLAAQLPLLTCDFGARGLELTDLEDAVIFERNTLLEKMILIAQMDEAAVKNMAVKALKKNMLKVEMKEALKNLVLSP